MFTYLPGTYAAEKLRFAILHCCPRCNSSLGKEGEEGSEAGRREGGRGGSGRKVGKETGRFFFFYDRLSAYLEL